MMLSSMESLRYLSITVAVVISITGTVGNLLAILAFAANSRIRSAFNLMVVNLAAVDCIISIAILPTVIYGHYEMEWPGSEESCVAFAYFYFSAHYTSAMFLVIISFNRYMHVARPHAMYSHIFSVKRRRLMAALTWFVSPGFLFPLLFTDGFNWWEGGLFCTFSRSGSFNNAYSLVMRTLFQFFPLLCMIVLYSLIFRAVRNSHASVDRNIAHSASCETVYSSTDTAGVTVTTPLGTPGAPPKRNYQLRLSPSTPKARSPSFRTPAGEIAFSPTWQSTPQLQHWLRDNAWKPRHPVRRSQTVNESTGANKKATLRRQRTNSKYAYVRPTKTIAEKDVLPENNVASLTTETNGLVQRQLSTSTTGGDVSSLKPNESLESLHKLNKYSKLNEKENRLKRSYSSRSVHKPERPRFLALSSSHVPSESIASKSPFSRSANLSMPSLRRSKSLSGSLNRISSAFRPIQRKGSKRRSIHHAKAQRKLLYMCIVICSAFAVCTLPSFLVNIFIENYGSIASELHMLTTILSWLTSLINPIVYAAMNKQFRKEYSRLLEKVSRVVLRKKKKKEKRNPNIPTVQVSETFIKH